MDKSTFQKVIILTADCFRGNQDELTSSIRVLMKIKEKITEYISMQRNFYNWTVTIEMTKTMGLRKGKKSRLDTSCYQNVTAHPLVQRQLMKALLA